MLKRHPDWKLRVFVVWEPVRAVDEIGPEKGTYARIPDRRVRQFWDRDQLLSRRMVRDLMENPSLRPDSVKIVPNTVIWDIAAIFPPKARWNTTMPRPAYYGRPVAKVAAELEERLAATLSSRP